MHPPAATFLSDTPLRPVAPPPGCPFTVRGLALGNGASPLEVLVAQGPAEANAAQVLSVWKARQGGRAAPLLLVVLDRERATLCGPQGPEPPTFQSSRNP